MTPVSPIAQQIWDMKYRLKAPDGTPVDKTVEDTWGRVAQACAAAEAEPDLWTERFRALLADYRFLPAGRILAGAGSGRTVTLFNCFVMGTIPDSLDGIFDHLRQAAVTMQRGGGIGYDFSTIRPKGAAVTGIGADASGPLSFMDVWDSMCRTIMTAGSRRGAMMACLRCDHPDVEAFVDAKSRPGRLRMFNLSVLVTDAFLRAIDEDAAWDLVFGGEVVRTISARGLWERIMRATYAYAEPGVIFIDRVNARNNLSYCEAIAATNPCVTADTWVMTAQGPRQVASLVGTAFAAVVDGVPHASGPEGFFPTGRRPVLRLNTTEGHVLRLTADHPVRRIVAETRWRRDEDWQPAGSLCPGDRVVLHDHRALPSWPGTGTEAEGYLLGLLIGDGCLKDDKAVLSVWMPDGSRGPRAVMAEAEAEAAARTLPHRADFRGWMTLPERNEHRLATGSLKALAAAMGLAPQAKAITPAMEVTSAAFHVGLLRGLFDADGSVQGTQAKGVSIRLAQSDPELLRGVQRMLGRLGIQTTLYMDRRPAQARRLPDGRGGHRDYPCEAQHELVIARDNLRRFAEVIGFTDTDKQARLDGLLAAYRRGLNRERFTATVTAVEPDGEAEVFDVRIPGVNAFDANGLMVHNCGEQPLPPYGTCLLGSINLPRFVHAPFEPEAALDTQAMAEAIGTAVRLLDDVIDVSPYPLDAQKREALTKRRIGLGVTGLADALVMRGLRYGSPEAVAATERWLAVLRRAAYAASIELAREKGPFPLFDRMKMLDAPGIQALEDDLRDGIALHGLRNALLTSIAPTGTISLFADNVSSGIEPIYALTARRRVMLADGSVQEEEVSDHAYRLFRRLKGPDSPLPEAFVDVAALSPEDHLVMQAAAQKYVDSAISKTINLPEDIPFADFQDVYRRAYDLGCKGCTTYRPNPVTGSVLSTQAAERAEEPMARPQELPGSTYKLRWPESDHAIYITVNDIEQDGRRRPFEVFINSKNMEHYAWTVALTRMISAVFRRGGDVAFVVEELKAVFDPRGGMWVDGRYVPSLLAAIGDVIEKHMLAIGFLDGPVGVNGSRTHDPEQAGAGRPCPRCGQRSLVRLENCDTCSSCGFSRCG